MLGDGAASLWVLLPRCFCSGRTPSLALWVWGMGCGLCYEPAAAPSSELREPHCNTAENPGSLLAKCCSCFLQYLNQDRTAPEVSPGCSRMARGEKRAGVPCMQRMRSISHPMMLFLPLLNKAIAPSWAWGHELVDFRSIQLFTLPLSPACCFTAIGPSALCSRNLSPPAFCSRDILQTILLPRFQVDPRQVCQRQLCCRCWFKSLKFLCMVPLLPLPHFAQPQKVPGSWKPFWSTCREG